MVVNSVKSQTVNKMNREISRNRKPEIEEMAKDLKAYILTTVN